MLPAARWQQLLLCASSLAPYSWEPAPSGVEWQGMGMAYRAGCKARGGDGVGGIQGPR